MATDKQLLSGVVSTVRDRAISPRLPAWILTQPYQVILYAFQDGRITPEQWSNYRSVWRYSAPRFSNLVPDSECPQVREAWKIIDARETSPAQSDSK